MDYKDYNDWYLLSSYRMCSVLFCLLFSWDLVLRLQHVSQRYESYVLQIYNFVLDIADNDNFIAFGKNK